MTATYKVIIGICGLTALISVICCCLNPNHNSYLWWGGLAGLLISYGIIRTIAMKFTKDSD